MNQIVAAWVERLPPDLQELWEERAAIMQFDAGLDREYAEALALLDVIYSGEITTLNEGTEHE